MTGMVEKVMLANNEPIAYKTWYDACFADLGGNTVDLCSDLGPELEGADIAVVRVDALEDEMRWGMTRAQYERALAYVEGAERALMAGAAR